MRTENKGMISGRVIDIKSEVLANGKTKIAIIIDTTPENGKYKSSARVQGYDQRAEKLADVRRGDVVECQVYCESKEFNGKWFDSFNIAQCKIVEEQPRPAATDAGDTAPQVDHGEPDDGAMPF